jgi:hypothetical protein
VRAKVVGLTSNDVENLLFWYGPLAFSFIALVTALLWRRELPRLSLVFIVIGVVAVALSGLWIALLYAWGKIGED